VKIVLSESLSRHFAELEFSQRPTDNQLRNLIPYYYQQKNDTEWASLRCSAKLVADVFTMHRPEYNEISTGTKGEAGIAWLKDSLLGTSQDAVPNPKLLVDKSALYNLLSERFKAADQPELPDWLYSDRHKIVKLYEAVEYFVDALVTPITGPNAGVLFSPDPLFNRIFLELNTTVTADNILAILATAGIKITLPAIFVDTGDNLDINYVMEDELIAEVREKFESERESYISSLRRIIKDCYEGLRGGLYIDVLDYADKASNQEILVQVQSFEKAIQKSDKKLLDRIRVGAIQGIPSIAEALVDPKKSVLAQIGIELLKVLSKNFAENASFREASEKFPMATYSYRLRSYSRHT
jgi:hypothetical protein